MRTIATARRCGRYGRYALTSFAAVAFYVIGI